MSPVANKIAVHLNLLAAREITCLSYKQRVCVTSSGQGRSRVIDISKQPTVAGAAGQRACPEHRGETQYKQRIRTFAAALGDVRYVTLS